MIYVLVVITYFSGNAGNGQNVKFQEFNTYLYQCRCLVELL